MFRIKTKKKAGTATRKRKDLDDDDENDDILVEESTAEPMEVDADDVLVPKTIVKEENESVDVAGGGDQGTDDEEDAMLARMRSRLQKNKTKGSSAMSFSSKGTGAKKTTRKPAVGDDDENDGGDDMAGSTSASTAAGLLSFQEDGDKTSKKSTKKLRMRPNLSVAHTTDEPAETEESTTNLYSQDMLASLLREQNVLLRRAPLTTSTDESAMEVDDGELPVFTGEDEETKGESADEEFIPLNAKFMQAKKNKKRVTFGVQNEEYYPPKTTEVEEPVPASDNEEDDEGDQSKRWEEELMRRGGGHHVKPLKPQASRHDAKMAYPTRRTVPCASLGEVMRSIQRKMDVGSVERDRVARELARLDAESELIQKKLQQQRQELLVAGEEFEYFQVIEDFVKGLSFCLREKLPSIESEEKRRAAQWVASRVTRKEQREADIRNEIRFSLEGSGIQERQFVNMPPNMREQAVDTSDAEARLARLRKRYEAAIEPDTTPSGWDVFADAVEDINSIQNVSGRFQEWKYKFPDVYKNAYVDLTLTKLYAPYIRAELINWEPLAISMGGGVGVSGFPTRVSEMQWFKVLQQHQSQQNPTIEEPVSTLLRDIVISRLVDATKSRFDAFSPVDTQSVVDMIEDLVQLQAIPMVEHGLDEIVANVLTALTGEAKRLPLLALDDQDAANDRTRVFAGFLISEFCGLLENALTLFVALPNGALHDRGFNGVMQILHHLLAYVTHSRHLHKTTMFPQIQRTVDQLSSSSFMQRLLARSSREQLEFQRVLQLLASSLPGSAT